MYVDLHALVSVVSPKAVDWCRGMLSDEDLGVYSSEKAHSVCEGSRKICQGVLAKFCFTPSTVPIVCAHLLGKMVFVVPQPPTVYRCNWL